LRLSTLQQNHDLHFLPQHKIEDICVTRGHVIRKPAKAGFSKQFISSSHVLQTRRRTRISTKTR